ncbi:MAG: hypothetical protein HY360_25335 [Verrucomicrobia bacterium]|nr:hypothetical protein [Verrucomicrobiota bacterium]
MKRDLKCRGGLYALPTCGTGLRHAEVASTTQAGWDKPIPYTVLKFLNIGGRRFVVAIFTTKATTKRRPPSSMTREKLLVTIWVVMWVCATWLSAAEEPWLVYAATKTDKAPVVDGRLDEPCWQGIEQTRPLTCIGGAAAPIVTKGMACWDAKNLYVGLVCAEPMWAAIQQKKADGLLKPFDESVEIFIDADHDHFTYIQFRVDFLGNRDAHVGPDPDSTMDKRWTGAAAQDQDQWTVEAAIPWNLVTKRLPDEKTIWGLNLNRSRTISAEGGWTCWSDTKGPFHSPSKFGHLVFFPYPIFLQNYFAASFRATKEEIDRSRRRLKVANAADADRMKLLQAESDQFLKSLQSIPIAGGAEAAADYTKGGDQERKWESFQSEVNLRLIRNLSATSKTTP